MLFLCPLTVGFHQVDLSDHLDVAVMGALSISRTSHPASGD